MNLIKSLIYGIISGISSYLPVSAQGHQILLLRLFGMTDRNPLLDLVVHFALLTAVIIGCRQNLNIFTRAYSLNKRRSRSRWVHVDKKSTYEIRLISTAAIPMIIFILLQTFVSKVEANLLLICLCFIINGTILYVTDHLRHSNKDASHMSALDSLLIGLLSGLSVFSGISRIGGGLSAAVGRGADKSNAFNWALILSVPALAVFSLFDLIAVFQTVSLTVSFLTILGYLLAAVGAFTAGYATIMLMRFLVVNTGFTGFAWYSWGVAILSFVLYLIA